MKLGADSICLVDTCTESGWVKSLEVIRLSLFSVSTRACLETELPASPIGLRGETSRSYSHPALVEVFALEFPMLP
jgi:hypothetical protein